MILDLPEVDQKLIEEIKKRNIDKIYKNETLVSFIESNKLSKEIVYDNLSSFLNALDSLDKCSKCMGLLKCPLKGLKNDLFIDEGRIYSDIVSCEKLREYTKFKNSFKIFEGSDSALNYSLQDTLISFKEERKNLIAYLAKIIKRKVKDKGIFLFGNEGVGKTFIMSIFAKLVIEHLKLSCAYIDSSTWMIDLSNMNYQNTIDYDNKMALFKKVNILIIDNLGDEKRNGFYNTDSLCQILEARDKNKLPTFFISSYPLYELKNIYSFTKNGKENTKKIIDYIDRNCEVFFLDTMKYPF